MAFGVEVGMPADAGLTAAVALHVLVVVTVEVCVSV